MRVWKVASMLLLTAAVLTRGAPAEAQGLIGVHVILDCGFSDVGAFEVRRVDTANDLFVRGVGPGQDCIEAYAVLRGRLETLRRHGARVDVKGPIVADLGPGDASGIPGCDIWDLMGNTAPPSTPNTAPIAHAVLTCGVDRTDDLVVRFLGSNRPILLRGLEEETSCAQAIAVLETRFARLGRRAGVPHTVRGPAAGKILGIDDADTLTWQYEVVPTGADLVMDVR